jgi:carbon-monoxide dehydrogenase medium subunit
LLATLAFRLSEPSILVDITRVPELAGITLGDGVLQIGALTRHAELGRDQLVARHAPLLTQAVPLIAHPAIRNRGTIGGSLCHADPAADWVNAALVLGATVRLEGPGGARRLPVEDFVRGAYATALGAGEVLAAVELPAFGPSMRWGWNKICPKVGEFADAIGAVVVDPSIGHCRVLVGAVEARPVLLPDAAALLAGLGDDPLQACRTAVERSVPGRDPVFVHQHAVALARAIDAMNARRP